ncbi:MAG: LytTR family transcriptional regulator DNA-binding domain-containing protein [Bacteroidales bacterium]|nr:LytTR family transcriptional regulator DNA-binding domain-containing protein [Bacteroidales bacterium]MCM1148424.1 LytTR family transcriptional regulator DNA-binding domain-containing protein [Bacteroidales bacterium]MCM1207052.1 LytTR family transcriptional regulator DNA-binding domain-containing protein [Bacillota bacterium]MCM1510794.1 LytTR family transcriptional regulator DNA-binding domain-containing protein [Clostridium sp.]
MENTLILHVPEGEKYTIVLKQTDLGDNPVWMEVVKNSTDMAEEETEKTFFYFKDRVRTMFRPLEYAYIESTSNHYSLWHPIDPTKPVVSIYMSSMANILAKLHDAGVTQFMRIHASYIVNKTCIESHRGNTTILRGQRKAIPIGHGYKENFHKKMVTL